MNHADHNISLGLENVTKSITVSQQCLDVVALHRFVTVREASHDYNLISIG